MPTLPRPVTRARALLDGGPLSGSVHVIAGDGEEIIEVEVPADGGGTRVAVYRRALYIPTRYTFQGMKPVE